MTATTQYFVHPAGTKMWYPVNDGVNGNSIKCQVTLGGRTTTTTKVLYRPYLQSRPDAIAVTDFEINAGGVVTFAPVGAVINHTVSIDQLRLSHILIDDSANGSADDIWVHITQF